MRICDDTVWVYLLAVKFTETQTELKTEEFSFNFGTSFTPCVLYILHTIQQTLVFQLQTQMQKFSHATPSEISCKQFLRSQNHHSEHMNFEQQHLNFEHLNFEKKKIFLIFNQYP